MFQIWFLKTIPRYNVLSQRQRQKKCIKFKAFLGQSTFRQHFKTLNTFRGNKEKQSLVIRLTFTLASFFDIGYFTLYRFL